jgi:sugar lactone lactonase YvrE
MADMRKTVRGRARRATAGAILAAAAIAVLPVATASAAEVTPILTGQSAVVDVAFDPAGNLYMSDYTGQVQVLPRKTGTLFGQSVTAGTVTTLATLENVPGITFHAGDLFMTDQTAGTISVLAPRAATVFGTPVAADTVTTIASGLGAPLGIAFDARGDLYVANQTGVSVLPAFSTTLYGQPVVRNTLVQLTATAALTPATSTLPGPAFLAFDRAGGLFVSDVAGGTVSVLPAASGTVFGQAVTAGTLSTVLSGVFQPTGIALDSSGNLFVSVPGNVDLLPAATGTVDGQSVTADTLTSAAVGVNGLGMTSFLGHPYLADQIESSVDKLTTPTAHVTRVTFSGTPIDPQITITGYGFNTAPATTAAGCSDTGLDYPYGNLYVYDANTQVQMGVPGDCVGLITSTLTSTKIVLTLGSDYANVAPLAAGDALTVVVGGRAFSATVTYPDS